MAFLEENKIKGFVILCIPEEEDFRVFHARHDIDELEGVSASMVFVDSCLKDVKPKGVRNIIKNCVGIILQACNLS